MNAGNKQWGVHDTNYYYYYCCIACKALSSYHDHVHTLRSICATCKSCAVASRMQWMHGPTQNTKHSATLQLHRKTLLSSVVYHTCSTARAAAVAEEIAPPPPPALIAMTLARPRGCAVRPSTRSTSPPILCRGGAKHPTLINARTPEETQQRTMKRKQGPRGREPPAQAPIMLMLPLCCVLVGPRSLVLFVCLRNKHPCCC